jgi:hypothetical protein
MSLTTIDTLIAAIALEYEATVFTYYAIGAPPVLIASPSHALPSFDMEL